MRPPLPVRHEGGVPVVELREVTKIYEGGSVGLDRAGISALGSGITLRRFLRV